MVSVWRNMTELEFANRYTYRDLQHMGATYFKDRMLVVSSVASGLKGSLKPGKDQKTGATKGRLPSWFQGKPGAKVVDLDGPIEALMPYVGGIGGLKK